jgi:hypothetical protein
MMNKSRNLAGCGAVPVYVLRKNADKEYRPCVVKNIVEPSGVD